jgi:hypothetical protein
MEKQFEDLKKEICKEVCEYLRHRKVAEGIISVTGMKILSHGNQSKWLAKALKREEEKNGKKKI